MKKIGTIQFEFVYVKVISTISKYITQMFDSLKKLKY